MPEGVRAGVAPSSHRFYQCRDAPLVGRAADPTAMEARDSDPGRTNGQLAAGNEPAAGPDALPIEQPLSWPVAADPTPPAAAPASSDTPEAGGLGRPSTSSGAIQRTVYESPYAIEGPIAGAPAYESAVDLPLPEAPPEADAPPADLPDPAPPPERSSRFRLRPRHLAPVAIAAVGAAIAYGVACGQRGLVPAETPELAKVVAPVSSEPIAADPAPSESAASADDAASGEEGQASVEGLAPRPPRPAPLRSDALLSDVIDHGCSTTVVRGLSEQIIAESNCLAPGAYGRVPTLGNLKLGDAVFPYMAVPARDALAAALRGSKHLEMRVNSMLRTVPQQYLLYAWYKRGRCGITLASVPGESNHQSGLAIDVSNPGDWRKTLTRHGFRWLGSKDKWHFDYTKGRGGSRPGLDVLAFQRLWNRNHPDDLVPATGAFDAKTEERLRKAPASGFALGATCARVPDREQGADEPPRGKTKKSKKSG